MDELSPPSAILSVSELTLSIKSLLEPTFSQVLVRGQISGLKPAASGHLYFTLKDDTSVVSAAWFGFSKRKILDGQKDGLELEEGLEVICEGRLSVYAPRGNYQLIVNRVRPLQLGDMHLAFEKLKEKLAAEGLFAEARKRPIPRFVKSVAIVTSLAGAAIRDILYVFEKRAPHIHIVIVPALVQGQGASASLVEALQRVDRLDLGEIILVTRGGGSAEDLGCFNDEAVVRAISALSRPVISAVGHEIDFTISDFVADLRAPTPTAAAMILTEEWLTLSEKIEELSQRLDYVLTQRLYTARAQVESLQARLRDPRQKLKDWKICSDLQLDRLRQSMKNYLQDKCGRFEIAAGKLEMLSPLAVLGRGYAILSVDQDVENFARGQIVRKTSEIKPGLKMKVRLQDGDFRVEALK